MPLITRDFYTRPDVVLIAKELLGKLLVTRFDGRLTSGIISETEAYEGITDRASHAYGGRRSDRTEIMYRIGGTAYIYLCYGIHSLFNIVTSIEGIPHAILIRGILPVDGIPIMLKRTGRKSIVKDFADGPGKVTKALGIHYSLTGSDLTKTPLRRNVNGIWVEDINYNLKHGRINVTPRIGVDYAGDDALKPYRFIYTP
jgi:DNA-3-methyladenine glycosylase